MTAPRAAAPVAALLLALSAPAAAEDDSILRTEGTDCDQNAIPIAGSSGFENARHALRTTAQTYSAAAYAERHLFPSGEAEEKGGAFSYEFFSMIGAAHIPTYEENAKGSTNCPSNYAVSLRPVDLQAVAMGFAFHKGAFGGFYAASAAYGNPAMPNNAVRGMLLGAQPIYAAMVLGFAPLARNGLATQQGASAFNMDWVAGATYTSEVIGVRAGYAGSRGFYANLAENKLGLFASGMLGGEDRGEGLLGYVRAGLDRARLGQLIKGAGLSSLYLRDLPFGVPPAGAAAEDAGAFGGSGRLRTWHLEQANIARKVDVAAALATAPVSTLYTATLGFHSDNYVPRRDAHGAEDGVQWNLRGGMVTVPGQAALGLEGGRYASARVDVGGQFTDGGGKNGGGAQFRGGGALLLNDPELLALYPYAVNSVTLRFYFDGDF